MSFAKKNKEQKTKTQKTTKQQKLGYLKKIKIAKHMQIKSFKAHENREISMNSALEDRWPVNPQKVITQLSRANWTMCLPASMATSLILWSQMPIRQDLALKCSDVPGIRWLRIHSSSFNPHS